MIPKIIHQTYINTSIPEQWKSGQQSCIDLHADYEYMVCPQWSWLREPLILILHSALD
jgi:mannosyltransferase OCH1-like enzyme